MSLNSLVSEYVVFDSDGRIDKEKTIQSYKDSLLQYDSVEDSISSLMKEELDTILQAKDNVGKRVTKGHVVACLIHNMGYEVSQYKELEERLDLFLYKYTSSTRDQSVGRPYTITVGRNGGIGRWDLLPVEKE